MYAMTVLSLPGQGLWVEDYWIGFGLVLIVIPNLNGSGCTAFAPIPLSPPYQRGCRRQGDPDWTRSQIELVLLVMPQLWPAYL